ncbi:MAG: tetratricopeptide repeat protein [Myxococcaceae bacterium]
MLALALTASLILGTGETDLQTLVARKHFRAAEASFREGRLREAVAEFEAAYRARPHPSLFFNIAKCHEQLGEVGAALRNYREYLRQLPEAKDRELVTRSIEDLSRRPGADEARAVLRLVPIASAVGPAGQRRVWTYLAAGTAGAATIAGVGFGLGASSTRDELLREVHPKAQAQALHNTAAGRATAANAAYGLAGAAAVTALVLLLLEPDSGEPSR